MGSSDRGDNTAATPHSTAANRGESSPPGLALTDAQRAPSSASKKGGEHKDSGSASQQQQQQGAAVAPGSATVAGAPIAAQTFTFAELQRATRNFSAHNFVGEGGFGRVYKGKLESTGQVGGTAGRGGGEGGCTVEKAHLTFND